MSQQARYCFETLRDAAWQPPVMSPGDWPDREPLMVSGINEHIRAADTRIMLLMDPTPHLSPEKIARKLWTIKKHFIYILREYLDLILNKYWLTI